MGMRAAPFVGQADAPLTLARPVARNGGIDALRAAVTLLVVLHHTAITYGALGGWYYKEIPPSMSASSVLLILFCTINQAWFMGLFFLLAGYYTPPAFVRHGAGGFIRGRLVRLGLPIIVYGLLLHPLTVALAATARGKPFLRVFAYIWEHGLFEPGPLWFTEALLLFSAVWLGWRLIAGAPRAARGAFPPDSALLVAALATGVAAFFLRLLWPVGVTVGFLQLGYFASYIVLFAAGCRAAEYGWLERIPPRQMRRWRHIAWIALPLFPLVGVLAWHVPALAGRAEGGWNVPALTYALWEPFVAWGFILALLSYFQVRFADLGGTWRHLTRRAYLIYIIHPPILVAVALAWRSVAAPVLLKFAVTGCLACALCYLAAGILLRIPGVARVV